MNSPARGRIADSSPASAGSTEPAGAGAVPDEPDDPGYAAAYRAFAAMRNLVLGSDDRRREVADATGLSFSRSRALRRLARKPMRMTELAAEMATDKPYTTLSVDDVERRGLVVRRISPQDR
ncbi:MAG: MarR family transcriptional regulator, partial [Streptomycetaceae bacterium]|nr:MarR family transcriptional regulator [Streptomycetaceae bacterium]